MLTTIFWSFTAVVFYVYVGYPLLVVLAVRFFRPRPLPRAAPTPTVSLVVAAYNEERTIGNKIENTLALAYPKDRIEIIVVSDGSTDATDRIVRGFGYDGVRLVRLGFNQGKSRAQNRGVAEAKGEIILFSDADVELLPDALETIVAPFADEKVGCVIGKIVYTTEGETGVTRGEGLYWRYEVYLRQKESDLGNLAMGSGLLAIRRDLFEYLDQDVGDDFVLPMKSAIRGRRVIYEPDAAGRTVLYQSHSRDMFRTRVRIITKDLRGLFSCKAIMNPFAHPLYAWGLISHKLLRWLVPYFLIGIFFAGVELRALAFYRYMTVAQIIFYYLAVMNLMLGSRGKDIRLLYVASSFCLVNSAAFVGVLRFITGKRSGRWQPIR
ncbi:MAG: glycosyltransferase family 2 protein [Syntrophorhabdales bacterium]|jgi:cellulose synthase/poly-beta-1,6-N-acetylglucosamine synthase-like glycosyltransferase